MERKRYNRDDSCAVPRTTKWRRTIDQSTSRSESIANLDVSECLPFAEELLEQYDDRHSTDLNEFLEPSYSCKELLSDYTPEGGAASGESNEWEPCIYNNYYNTLYFR